MLLYFLSGKQPLVTTHHNCAEVAELADAPDSKSDVYSTCRFESGLRHQSNYQFPILKLETFFISIRSAGFITASA